MTVAGIIAHSVSDQDRHGKAGRPVWRHLGSAERERLFRDHESGVYVRCMVGIEYDLYLDTETDYACVTRGVDKIISVERTPELMALAGANRYDAA